MKRSKLGVAGAVQIAAWYAIAATSAVLTGCQEIGRSEGFVQEDQPRQVDRIAVAQATAGAREDRTLYAIHFDGEQLNSLGVAKLNLIAEGLPADRPATVYLSMPQNDLTAQRQMTVSQYLAGAGLQQAKIELGPNPDLTVPAQASITRMQKTETKRDDRVTTGSFAR